MTKEREHQLEQVARAQAINIHYSLAYIKPLKQEELDLIMLTMYNELVERNGLERGAPKGG